jgi:hypothetical protein
MIMNDNWAIFGMDFHMKTALNNILGYLRKPPNVVVKNVTFKNLTHKKYPIANADWM